MAGHIVWEYKVLLKYNFVLKYKVKKVRVDVTTLVVHRCEGTSEVYVTLHYLCSYKMLLFHQFMTLQATDITKHPYGHYICCDFNISSNIIIWSNDTESLPFQIICLTQENSSILHVYSRQYNNCNWEYTYKVHKCHGDIVHWLQQSSCF